MPLPIVITLIICGTFLTTVILSLLFAMWVITKGIAVSEQQRKK